MLPGPYPVLVIDSALASAGVILGTDLTVHAIRDSVVKATLVAPSPSDFQRKACSMLMDTRQWVVVRVERGRTPVNEARWDVGYSLGTPDELILASGITGTGGTFGFCDRHTAGRVFDIRARDNTPSAQPVVVTVKGAVKDLSIELPPKPAP